jgi:maleylacetoacetate isomerase
MSAKPKLYDYWRSSAAYRVRIALNLKGIDYEIVPVSLKPGDDEQASEAYREINPQGLVPFYDDGEVATGQSMAILEYLDEAHSDPVLLPNDEADCAAVRSFCLGIACEIHPLNNLRVLKYLEGTLGLSEEQSLAWYRHWVTEGFRAAEIFAEENSADGRFVFGSAPTLADCFLVPQMFNARRFDVPLDDFPTLVGIVDSCNQLSAFKDAYPVDPDG